MSAQNEPVIQLQNVSKRFRFTPDMPQSVLESIISIFSRNRSEDEQDLWAVEDISFDIMPGQSMGIIGRNGSGKSTLLKLISRILQPTTGKIAVRGRVSALLELGAGFHADLTGRENIFLNASVLGLTREEIELQYDSIVAFSELEEFIDMPVKHYSSGMYMRLGFSVAIHVDPDVLIVDEILAVGDQSFQAKCLDRIMDMKRRGVTILIISHDLTTIERLCSHIVWLDKGAVRASGPAEKVIEQYRDHMDERVGMEMTRQNESGGFKRWGTHQIEIEDVRFLDDQGEDTAIFHYGSPLTIEMHYNAHEPIEEPEFGLAIHRNDGVHITGPNSQTAGLEMGVVEGRGVVRYRIDSLPLLPARYQLTAAIHDSKRPIAYDFHEEAYAFRVVGGGTDETEGILALPASWAWQPDTTPVALPEQLPEPAGEPA